MNNEQQGPQAGLSDAGGNGQEWKDKYELLVNLLPQVVFEADLEGRLTFVNVTGLRRFNYSEEDLQKGLSIFEMLPEHERQRATENFAKVLAGKLKSSNEYQALTKDGSIFPILAYSAPIFKANRPIGLYGVAIDLTERRHAIEELAESEARYRTLVESSSDAILRVDLGRRIVSFNKGLLDLFGFTGNDVEGQSTRVLYPSDDSFEEFGKIVLPVVKQNNSFRTEWRFRKKDGTVFPAESVTSAVRAQSGGLMGYVSIIRDITERNQAEERLRQSEHFLEQVVNTSPDLIFLFDIIDRRPLYQNRQVEEFSGMTGPQIQAMGPEFFETVLGFENTFFVGLAQKLTGEGEPAVVETECPMRDRRGEWRWFRGRSAVFERTAEGRARLVLTVTHDATEQRRVEENRRLLAVAVEQATDMIIVTDQNGIIEYVNKAFEAAIGYRQPDIMGKDISILRTSRRGEELYHAQLAAIKAGNPWSGHVAAGGTDRNPLELEIAVSPIRDRVITHFVSILRNVTHEKMLEDRLRQAQKMEAIGTLAGGIAHDFNNILAAMIGNAELALDDLPSGVRTRQNVEQILQSGLRGRDLVQQILTFSRRAAREPKALQLGPLVKETGKLIRASTPSTIEIRIDDSAASDTILADPVQMQQVLVNLCANATQAMEEKAGVLEIALKDASFKEDEHMPEPGMVPGDYIAISVRDTGSGMTEEAKRRLFEPFFTTKRQGTGMGLAIVYGIVKSYGGAIIAESELGSGSIFTVYLPKTAAEAEAEEELVEISEPGGHERVLLVDDEEVVVRAGKEILERLGYQVTAMTRSIEALRLFSRDPQAFDLVILDQTMPEMTGAALAEVLMRIRPGIPIVLATGYSHIVSAEKAKQLGIREFVMKPLIKRELAETVRKAIEGRE